jgi:hypothetical protein
MHPLIHRGLEPEMADRLLDQGDVKKVASQIDAEIRALSVQNTPGVRAIRRKYSRRLRRATAEHVLALARELLENYDQRLPAQPGNQERLAQCQPLRSRAAAVQVVLTARMWPLLTYD